MRVAIKWWMYTAEVQEALIFSDAALVEYGIICHYPVGWSITKDFKIRTFKELIHDHC